MNEKQSRWRVLDQQARALRLAGHLEEAIDVLKQLVHERPDWEHGQSWYDLACCEEDLGRITEAEEYYRAALSHQPGYFYFVGGFASFLYRFGRPDEAFEMHLKLLRIYAGWGDSARTDSVVKVLMELGGRMGIERETVEARIKSIGP